MNPRRLLALVGRLRLPPFTGVLAFVRRLPLAGLLALAACTPNSDGGSPIQSVVGRVATPAPAPAPGTSALPAATGPGTAASLGGGDLGGGNGILGKPLETYRVRIDRTEEFREFIQPVLQRVEGKLPLLALEMWHVVQRRAWYFVPVKLQTLPADLIAVGFPTEQLALQTHQSVWFDFAEFLKMDRRARAQLLLHEIVMGLKILNFASYGDQCEARRLRSDNPLQCSYIDRVKLPAGFDEFFRAQKVELSRADYDAIRFITTELFDGKEPADNAGLVDLLAPVRKYPADLELRLLEAAVQEKIPLQSLIESMDYLLRQNITGFFSSTGDIRRGQKANQRCHLELAFDAKNQRGRVRLRLEPLAPEIAEEVFIFHVKDEEQTTTAEDRKFWMMNRLVEDKTDPQLGDERWELEISRSITGVQQFSLARSKYVRDHGFQKQLNPQPSWSADGSFVPTPTGFKASGVMCFPTRSLYLEL